MSTEVLQSFPLQWNALLTTINTLDSIGLMDKFDFSNAKPCLSYHVYFQIQVICLKITVKHIVVDKGASTTTMSLSCWKALIYPQLSQSMTMLTAFDGNSFKAHEIIPSL